MNLNEKPILFGGLVVVGIICCVAAILLHPKLQNPSAQISGLHNSFADVTARHASDFFSVTAQVILLYPPYTEAQQKEIPKGTLPLIFRVKVKSLANRDLSNVCFSLQVPEEVRNLTGHPIFYVGPHTKSDVPQGTSVGITDTWFIEPIEMSSIEFRRLAEAVEQDTVIELTYEDCIEKVIVKPSFSWQYGTAR